MLNIENNETKLIVILSHYKNNNLWDKLLAKTSNSIIFYGDP